MKKGNAQISNSQLRFRMFFGVSIFIGLMFAIIFISAGRWDFWHGWVYFILFSYFEMFSFLIIPSELLRERYGLPPGTKKWDKLIYYIFTILAYIILLIAALDGGRYHWSGYFPIGVNIVAFFITFLGYTFIIICLRVNKYFSSTVRIQLNRGQYVIDKGPYSIIRHPGYAGTIISSVVIPIAMNSLWAFIPAGLFALTIIIRTFLEDIALQKELPGYLDYIARVKYRLIPFIW